MSIQSRVSVVNNVLNPNKQQDAAYHGETQDHTGTTFFYAVIYDGHGGNDCIQRLRQAHQYPGMVQHLLGAANPLQAVYDFVKECNGGSTMNLFRIYEDRIENWNVGDSHAFVFDMTSGTVPLFVGQSVDDDHERPDMTEWFQGIMHDGLTMTVTGRKTMQYGPTKMLRVLYPNRAVAVSQALGHRGMTGLSLTHAYLSIPRQPTVCYSCVNGSDGVWDVVSPAHFPIATMAAETLCQLAKQQWSQQWELTHMSGDQYHGQTTPNSYAPETHDDISATTTLVFPFMRNVTHRKK